MGKPIVTVQIATLTVFVALSCNAALSQESGTPSIGSLFTFTCEGELCANGLFPMGLLMQGSDGNLYGATSVGGTASNSGGTIFQITPTGALSTLHSFDADGNGQFPDGKTPTGSLVDGKDGFLYGTTLLGGAHGAGTVFKISKDHTFELLYNFCSLQNCADGSSPTSLTLGRDGNLYAGTASGGKSNNGTIFRISRTGSLKTIHSLNGIADSGAPNVLIQASNGNFYATTGISGSGQLGTLFRVTRAGAFATLHNFSAPPDADPLGSLLQASDGNLYGATFYGEIFQSALTGNFKIIVPAPFDPIRGGLVQGSDGNLWGTHQGVGSNPGDVFSQTLTGKQLQRVTFNCPQNGGAPQGMIQATDGKFYGVGTACVDATGKQHLGTVFVVNAGLPVPVRSPEK
jgi:uncharacterized repeat protein (TIGR03803 family)